MARGTQTDDSGNASTSAHEQKDCKLLITELMGFVLKPTKDK